MLALTNNMPLHRWKTFRNVLIEGILASITGGCTIRVYDGLIPNVLLLIVWLVLFLLPLTLYYLLFYFTHNSFYNIIYWVLYIIAIALFFFGLKVTNFRLHRLFDLEDKRKRKRAAKLEKLRKLREPDSKIEQQEDNLGRSSVEALLPLTDDIMPDPITLTTPSLLIRDDNSNSNDANIRQVALEGLSEQSSINLKCTTPSLQNQRRQTSSLEMNTTNSVSSLPLIPSTTDINHQHSEQDDDYKAHIIFDRAESSDNNTHSSEDKFMTPVKLPNPYEIQTEDNDSFLYSNTEFTQNRPSTPSLLSKCIGSKSPYKMPSSSHKISRSHSYQELETISDNQHIANFSTSNATTSSSNNNNKTNKPILGTAKSYSTMDSILTDARYNSNRPSDFVTEIAEKLRETQSEIMSKPFALSEDSIEDNIYKDDITAYEVNMKNYCGGVTDHLFVEVRDKKYSSLVIDESKGATPLNYTSPEVSQALDKCLWSDKACIDPNSDLFSTMSENEMIKLIEFAHENDGHITLDQNDTNPGATHYYRDLIDGVLIAYKFGSEGEINEKRIEVDKSLTNLLAVRNDNSRRTGRDSRTISQQSSFSTSTDVWDPNQSAIQEASPVRTIGTITSDVQIIAAPASKKIAPLNSTEAVEANKLAILPNLQVAIFFNRTDLEKYFDRDLSWLDIFLAVFLSISVSCLGIGVLSLGYYHHVWNVLFCFVMASCQFSLIRSVIPDPASPIHGYNRYLAPARAFYFSIVALTALLLHIFINRSDYTPLIAYGFNWNDSNIVTFSRNALLIVILCIPVGAVWGLLPQIDTFTIYIIEKVDIYVFGGTSILSVSSGLYAILRSIMAAIILSGIGIGAYYSYPPTNINTSLNFIFAIHFGLIFSFSYLLSRLPSCPSTLFELITNKCNIKTTKQVDECEIQDPVPTLLRQSLRNRLVHDFLISIVIFIAIFLLAVTTLFTISREVIPHVLRIVTIIVGIVAHYIIPQLRKRHPWLFFKEPVLRSKEHSIPHEVFADATICYFEIIQVWITMLELYILYPLVFLEAMINSAFILSETFGFIGAGIILSIAGLRVIRMVFCEPSKQYVYLLFTYLFFTFDYPQLAQGFILDYFILSIVVEKIFELKHKLHFLFIYQAPWHMPWSGMLHFIVHPLLIPHPGFVFLQTVLSAFLSAPLSPFLASSLFLLSYVRPIKFWEKSYRTRHLDNTETRLSSVLETHSGPSTEHLDSIFYDHLAHSLQRVLAGEILMGRWGIVKSGDFFILSREADNITALVHIIEVGNGFITFQLRGSEFKGTYCQSVEVQSLNEGLDNDDEKCCCCKFCCKCSCPPFNSKNFFCFNAYCNSRWSGWEIMNTAFVLHGYSKAENDASIIFNCYEAFRVYNQLYVKAMVYYLIKSPMFISWLQNESIQTSIAEISVPGYVDPHPHFLGKIDLDFDARLNGVTFDNFRVYFIEWIQYCLTSRAFTDELDINQVTLFCWAVTLLGRRVLGNATQIDLDSSIWNVSFLHGVYALFKGDYRINSPKDEWVFADMDILRKVISPAIKVALKLHQDHYPSADDQSDDHAMLIQEITTTEQNMIIAHEGDPQWIRAIVSNKPSLFTLRYNKHDTNRPYQFIRLNTRHLKLRVIKINKEVVTGLWASQQQEQVYFRQRNEERASIQNLKCVLRNLVNSSMDQPIGYPIYVSPLLTSYSDMSATFTRVTGGLVQPAKITRSVLTYAKKLEKKRHKKPDSDEPRPKPETTELEMVTFDNLDDSPSDSRIPDDYIDPFGDDSDDSEDPFKPAEILNKFVNITDVTLIHSNIQRMVQWPDPIWQKKANRSGWKGWLPEEGMTGKVIHVWKPCHYDAKQRSHLDKTIVLILINNKYYVPISESGVCQIENFN